VNLALLRLEGRYATLVAVARRLALRPEQAWKEGEPRRDGTPYRSSGYCVTIADTPDPAQVVRAIRVFVTRCRERAVVFSQEGLRAELSIGFAVGEGRQHTAGFEFSTADLLALAQCGIALQISAYPTSHAANG
jgi:hypothetical protein